MSISGPADDTIDGARVLVTGAAGFTGRRLCAVLLSAGACVTAVARRDPGLAAHDRLTLLIADLCETPALAGPFDAAIHCAATSPGPNVTDDDIMRDNVEGGRKLVARLREAGCARVIFLSSLSVHGEITDAVVTPGTGISNPDTYGRSKHAVEQMLTDMSGEMPAVAIRLPGIVGPGAGRNWLTEVRAKALRGEEIVIFNPKSPYNNIIHVDDLVAFIVTLASSDFRGFEAFPIGAGGATQLRDAVECMIVGTGGQGTIRVEENDRVSFTLDNGTAEALGYRPSNILDVITRYAAEPESPV